MQITDRISGYTKQGSYIKETLQKAGKPPAPSLRPAPEDKVTISRQGRALSRNQFEQSQKSDKTDFTNRQNRKKVEKERDLESEKQSFERKQASEKQKFESEQAREKTAFLQGILNDEPASGGV